MENGYGLSFTAEQINVNLGNAEKAILHTQQTLTPEQQAQARENIGAGCKTKVIDFDELGLTDTLLDLVLDGGGMAAGNSNTFWEEVNTDAPIVIQFTFGEVFVENSVSTKIISGGATASLMFEAFVTGSDLSMTRVTTVIGRITNDPTGVNFIVKTSVV